MKKILRVAIYIIKLAAAYLCAFFIKMVRPSMRHIWIISERGDDARDNGYFFYKYLIDRHPELSVYYIIEDHSVDAKRIRAQHRIRPNSFRHFLVFALSRVRISSHAWGGDVPTVDYYRKLGLYRHSKKKTVFLQHGIIKDYLPALCYPTIRPDLFISGAEPEYTYVNRYFGYPDGVVRYLGLARFDNLHGRETKRQILFMPTFRRWLQGKDDAEIAQSEYFKAWNDAISDPRLAELLQKHHLDLIFYPHYVMQRYVELFRSDSPRVKIAAFKDYDVQTLLIESRLLVTDFSSVFFDFGYMEKPVIYYQFDRERYISEHYDFTKGYFSYDRDGFGDVVFGADSLITAIAEAADDQFKLKEKYHARVDAFFPLKDRENCARIYDAITNLYYGEGE